MLPNRPSCSTASCFPPAALCKAMASLDRSLRQHGSALVVRVGAWEEQLPQLAAELGAASILAEQEVEAGGWVGTQGSFNA